MNMQRSKVAIKAREIGVRIKKVVEEKNVFYLFKNKVAKYGIDLIVKSTKGKTGLDRLIFGSVVVTAPES